MVFKTHFCVLKSNAFPFRRQATGWSAFLRLLTPNPFFMNKTAVVTGITHGIGHAIAQKLRRQGYAVAGCARTKADLEKMQSETSNDGTGGLHTFRADLSIEAKAQAFAQQVLEVQGAPQILVNNAGAFEGGPLKGAPAGQLRRMMDVNLHSAYDLTMALLPAMIAAGGGHIFNICSVASLGAYPSGGAYSIAKWGLLGFTENLREELRGTGIRVTAVLPGPTWSRSWEGSGVAKETLIQPEDIAEMLWTASQLSEGGAVARLVIEGSL
jgi:short-subunit dehydrogenase